MHSPSSLPQPDADAHAHSERLREHIRARIVERGGWVGFAEYMDLCLYAPALGYYSAGAAKFGAAGDFVTAPEVSPLFGRCVARAIAPALAGGGRDVLELGAGTGAMAVELLRTLARDGALPGRYRILEVSADLRERQLYTLQQKAPEFISLVDWLDELPTELDGVVVANEVLDALPVERFRIGEGADRFLRVGVAADGNGFVDEVRPARDSLRDSLGAIEASLGAELVCGYESEFRPNLPAFVDGIAHALRDGAVLFVDYGLPRRELYSSDRRAGTLRCHYRHRAHDDPFLFPGLQDITAWVDFTTVAAAATAAGLRVEGYTTQAQFLIDSGIEAEYLAATAGDVAERDRLQKSREMQMLMMPGEMGERFKVMWLGKGSAPAPAWDGIDQRHRL